MSANGKSEVMYGSHSGGGHSSCPAGIPVEFALLSILAAFGVAFGVLYQALTIITGRRRKRNAVESEEEGAETEPEPEVGFVFRFADFLWLGEFYWLLHSIYWVDHLPLHSHLYHRDQCAVLGSIKKGWVVLTLQRHSPIETSVNCHSVWNATRMTASKRNFTRLCSN